jgi:hypothetical protein
VVLPEVRMWHSMSSELARQLLAAFASFAGIVARALLQHRKRLPLSSCALVKHRERFKDGAGEKMHDLILVLVQNVRVVSRRSGFREASVKRAMSLNQAEEKLKAGRYPGQGAAAARRQSLGLTFLRIKPSRQLMLCKTSSEACSQSRELIPIPVVSFWIYQR